jgi:hypothetical protein
MPVSSKLWRAPPTGACARNWAMACTHKSKSVNAA